MTPSAATAEFLTVHAKRWEESLRRLIRFRSTFEHEHAIADHVAGCIAELGLPVERVEHTSQRLAKLADAQLPFSDVPGRCSLVTRVRGSGGGRSLIVNTHLDIVPEGDPAKWTHDPFGAEIDAARGVVFGRGAMDDKAGVAISLALVECLVRMPVRVAGDVVFQYVLEDEITGNGSLLCLASGHTADGAVIIDGTRTDRLINEHAGQLQFDIEMAGEPASVCVSHLGRNAAEMIARLVVELRDAVHALNDTRTAPWTQFPSPFQLAVQRIESEGAQLTVPDRARARCYVTFPPPFTLERMRSLIAGSVADFEKRFSMPGATRVHDHGIAAEPVRSHSDALEQVVIDAGRRAGLPDIARTPSTGTSDLRHFVKAGIPCLLFGPGTGHNPHRADEHYYLGDLVRMTGLYLDVVQSWCGNS